MFRSRKVAGDKKKVIKKPIESEKKIQKYINKKLFFYIFYHLQAIIY